MSGFDEEAERERLREKYERDREKRTATQRMSELLLKGATMTNRHCDECGDPIFRYDGEEFCPTCQAEGPPASAAAGEGDDAGADSVEADAGAAPAEADAAREADDDRDAAGSADADSAAADAGAERVPTGRADVAADATVAPTADATRSRRTPGESSADPGGRSATDRGRPAAGDDLADARESLSRTLARFATAAEETDDPRRATELLAAAREAAEALSALERR